MKAYYNEIDPYCAQWLRNLIAAGHLPDGDVDDRDIRDVKPDDLRAYGQVHLFAGIGGFGLGLRMAGWPDDRPIWTGGYPCQPFSVAGKQGGTEDDRHLWPEMYRLLAECRPRWLIGENVAGHIAMGLDGVLSDLEGSEYTCRTFAIPACAVDAPHRRERVWIVGNLADTEYPRSSCTGSKPQSEGPIIEPRDDCGEENVAHGARDSDAGTDRERVGQGGDESHVVHPPSERRGEGRAEPVIRGRGTAVAEPGGEDVGNAVQQGLEGHAGNGPHGSEPRRLHTQPGRPTSSPSFWQDHAIVGGRRVKPGVRLLAHGIPQRVAKLRAFGNAVIPQNVREIVRAIMEAD